VPELPGFPPPTGTRAGWYPDPYRQDPGRREPARPDQGGPWLRYYDGYGWTERVAAPQHAWRAPQAPAEHPTLPFPVVVGAMTILAGSLVGSRVLLDGLLDRDWPVPALMVVSVVIGYLPSVAWLWFACRRWGSGRPLADLGVRFRWTDLGWGLIAWAATLVAMGIALAILREFDVPYRGNLDLHVFDRRVLDPTLAAINRPAVVSLAISAVVFAPLVEEVVFRGALLRGLLSKVPAVAAVGVQGIAFGAAHYNPEFGTDNVGLVVILSIAGCGFGLAAFLLRRIGPTIIGHTVMNGVALSVALARA
jgi:uncharacterized protein